MKIAVIGAGIAGLSAAHDLINAGHAVDVFEATDYTGGLAAGIKIPRWDWSVEHYYHHWFATDAHILGLIKEVGANDKIVFPRPITAVYHEGTFYALDSALAVLRFPGLPFYDRVRMGMVVAYLKYIARWEPLEKVTAAAWMQRAVGRRAYEVLWEPMLDGKFGPHAADVNMAWMWARFKARTTRLGTFEGGFQAFVDTLVSDLERRGVRIHLQTPVAGISPGAEGGLLLSLPDGECHFDQCLVTTAPGVMERLVPALPSAYLGQLKELKSMGAVVLILALRNRLAENGVYWHNLPKSAGFPFLSLVEHTNFVSPEFFGGDHIVYCGDYLDPGHEYFELTKEELLDRFLPALKRINPAFDTEWLRDSWLYTTRYAQPVPELNHAQRIPDVKTPIAGLWFASMSQIYPWDRGTNYAVEIGRLTAGRMMSEG
ncbi:MAG: NAD(P)/FAD-dependent oxidoreductase [Anaerolineales bacterium]|nr:NAD(P)/FAD-dependent oxidoreductase [Anaerolineales bacterium]